MLTDIIRYELDEGITEEFLREAAADILEVWMKKQEGFLGWEISKGKNGYVDFVYWENQAAADQATANMRDIPTGHNWMKCYDMDTITTEKVESIFSFQK